MNTTPSMSQLITSVRQQIDSRIIPELSEPATVVEAQMMLGVLDMLAIRAENEVDWMVSEIIDVEEALAAEAQAGRLDGAASEALEALQRHSHPDLSMPALREHYDVAGEAVSRAAEAAYAAQDEALQAVVWRLIEKRLQHEQATIGIFRAVGRTEGSLR